MVFSFFPPLTHHTQSLGNFFQFYLQNVSQISSLLPNSTALGLIQGTISSRPDNCCGLQWAKTFHFPFLQSLLCISTIFFLIRNQIISLFHKSLQCFLFVCFFLLYDIQTKMQILHHVPWALCYLVSTYLFDIISWHNPVLPCSSHPSGPQT